MGIIYVILYFIIITYYKIILGIFGNYRRVTATMRICSTAGAPEVGLQE